MFQNPLFMKNNFKIIVETLHVDDNGTSQNVSEPPNRYSSGPLNYLCLTNDFISFYSEQIGYLKKSTFCLCSEDRKKTSSAKIKLFIDFKISIELMQVVGFFCEQSHIIEKLIT